MKSRSFPFPFFVTVAFLVGWSVWNLGCSPEPSDAAGADEEDVSQAFAKRLEEAGVEGLFGIREWVVRYRSSPSGPLDSLVIETGRDSLVDGQIRTVTGNAGTLVDLIPEEVYASMVGIQLVDWTNRDSTGQVMEGQKLVRRPFPQGFLLDDTDWTAAPDGVYLDPKGDYIYSIGTAFAPSFDGVRRANGNANNQVTAIVKQVCPVHYSEEDLESDSPEIQQVKQRLQSAKQVSDYQGLTDVEILEQAGVNCFWDRISDDIGSYVFFNPAVEETRVIRAYPETVRMVNFAVEGRTYPLLEGENYMQLVRDFLLEEGQIAEFSTDSLKRKTNGSG